MSVQMQEKPKSLQAAEESQIAKDMGLIQPEEIQEQEIDPQISKTADMWLNQIMNCDLENQEQKTRVAAAVENIAGPIVTDLAVRNTMLKGRISSLANSAESSPVANALVDLKVKVDKLNPNNTRLLAPGSIGRWFMWIPGVGETLNRYVTRFQSANSVIESIVLQLKEGVEELRRNNDVLTEDKSKIRDLTIRLQKIIKAAMVLDERLSAEIEKLEQGSEQRRFLEEEVLFALRQAIQDRQQNLLVNQQAIISYEIIIRNNKELIRGARRCETVTVRALEVAVVIAMALENQKKTLETIEAVDQTTGDLLVTNSANLKKQGAEIHKKAAGTSISIEKLKQCFTDLNAAMDDIAAFKQKALPEMAGRIIEMDRMADEAKKSIEKMEKGNSRRPTINLDFDLSEAPNS